MGHPHYIASQVGYLGEALNRQTPFINVFEPLPVCALLAFKQQVPNGLRTPGNMQMLSVS